MTRDLAEVDRDLCEAWWRRQLHSDIVSRTSNMRAIDALLDERFALKPVKVPR